MKFAKELEQEMVPEWRAKYMNYKQAKKRLKTVDRLHRSANPSPRPFSRHLNLPTTPKITLHTPSAVFSRTRGESSTPRPKHAGDDNALVTESTISLTRDDALRRSPPGTVYVGPSRKPLPALHLPAAAISDNATLATIGSGHRLEAVSDLPSSQTDLSQSAAQESEARARSGSVTHMARAAVSDASRNVLGKLSLSKGANSPRTPGLLGIQNEYAAAKDAFLDFLAAELVKVDSFYKEKEVEAVERLPVLREQLHLMRDRRIQDLKSIRSLKKKGSAAISSGDQGSSGDNDTTDQPDGRLHRHFRAAVGALAPTRIGQNSKSLETMTAATPHALAARDPGQDYSRRPVKDDVPYRVAKRKLKIALQEYHRSLELLRSYSSVNRTAFRKINKKYDKLTKTKPTLQFFNNDVCEAHFVKSTMVDQLTEAVEDLYTRYFERGNHKMAVSKLRSRLVTPDRYSGVLFCNALLLGAGLLMCVQALINATGMLNNDSSADVPLAEDSDDEGDLFRPDRGENVSYLLQIYGGYFLANFLSVLFCLACWFWTNSKINYVFIFEFNPRTRLEWQELLTLSSVCFFLLGLFGWINFSGWGPDSMFLWYPVLLIGVTAVILFMPYPIWYYRARRWFLYACWRLFWSGLYPVEFRDFFLGDMFCSLVYSMGNIALFFCIYGSNWDEPGDCNSSKSRLLGFFTTLPAIWRAVQCIRRYWDTRNAFPHLANCGKYVCNVLSYVTLSLYRIGRGPEEKAAFIVFAAVNTVFSTVWDILMDWSLLDFGSENVLLRDRLGYKQKWIYYAAMVLDPPLRSTWVLYAVFPLEIEHSAVLSFGIAFAEVVRRGMWLVFRLENEHCSNVGRFRASRDVPLPYSIRHSISSDDGGLGTRTVVKVPPVEMDTAPAGASGKDKDKKVSATGLRVASGGANCNLRNRAGTVTAGGGGGSGGIGSGAGGGEEGGRDDWEAVAAAAPPAGLIHRRLSRHQGSISDFSPIIRTLSHVAQHLHVAHTQDFERRRESVDADADGPGAAAAAGGRKGHLHHHHHRFRHDSDDDDDDDDDYDDFDDGDEDGEVDVEQVLEAYRRHGRGHGAVSPGEYDEERAAGGGGGGGSHGGRAKAKQRKTSLGAGSSPAPAVPPRSVARTGISGAEGGGGGDLGAGGNASSGAGVVGGVVGAGVVGAGRSRSRPGDRRHSLIRPMSPAQEGSEEAETEAERAVEREREQERERGREKVKEKEKEKEKEGESERGE